jgi:hypothetical protein
MKDTRSPKQKAADKYCETLEESLKKLTDLIRKLDIRVTSLERRPRTVQGYGRPQ